MNNELLTSVVNSVAIQEAAFPELRADQIESLREFGREKHFAKGDEIWAAGQRNLCMYVVVRGEMRIEDPRSHEKIADHKAGHFSGDIDVLSGRPSVVRGIAETDLDVLEIPADCAKSIVGVCPELGDTILRAFLGRRALLRQMDRMGVQVVGSRYSPDTLRIREFLSRNRIPNFWEDLESVEGANILLKEFEVTPDETPIVLLPNGAMLKAPTNQELARCLGVVHAVESKIYDLVIIGAGPGGLAAGVYGASEGLSTLVLDANAPGGQAGTSSRIENYMGFPLGLTGQDLADRAVAQAEKFGAEFVVPVRALSMQCDGLGGHIIETDGLGSITARCVILAAGAAYRTLEADNLDRFVNRGVYYAATQVERLNCRDQPVAVVGAGNSAGQAAIFMSENARKVHLVVRSDDLRRSMSSYLANRIELSSRVQLHVNAEICSLMGNDYLERAVIHDKRAGTRWTEECAGVFVMIGAIPCTSWLPDGIAKDAKGFVITGHETVEAGKWTEQRHPYFLETSCPGVFAVGDIRSGSVKRVASAVGEGSMAVALVHQFMSL